MLQELVLLLFTHHIDGSFRLRQFLSQRDVRDGCERLDQVPKPHKLLPQRHHLLLHLLDALIDPIPLQLRHLAPLLSCDI